MMRIYYIIPVSIDSITVVAAFVSFDNRVAADRIADSLSESEALDAVPAGLDLACRGAAVA